MRVLLLFSSINLMVGIRSIRASLVAQTVKNLPVMQKTWVWSLGWEDPLEVGMATHSSILMWRIPMETEEPSSLQSIGSQRVRHTERLSIAQHIRSIQNSTILRVFFCLIFEIDFILYTWYCLDNFIHYFFCS